MMLRDRGGVGRRVSELIVVGGMALAMTVPFAAHAQVEATSKTRPRASKATGSQASEADLAALEKKLDKVLANQQALLQQLDAMMEELRVIKMRATR